MDETNKCNATESACKGWNEYTLAFLLLRLWLAVRAIATGLEKYEGVTDGVRSYALSFYKAVPKTWERQFALEPLLPSWALSAYYVVLGPALILLGVALLLGICTRTTLFLMGLVYISITLGVVLIGQEPVAGSMGTHLLLVAVALMLVRHNRCQVFGKF